METSTTDGPAEGVHFLPDAASLLADDSPAVPDSGTPAADLAEPRETAGASDDEPAPPASAESDDASPPAQADDDSTPPTYDPFSFTVDGKEVSIPGSYETEDGLIVIPRAEWDTKFARQYVADRGSFNQRETELRAKLELLEAARNAPVPEVQKAKALEARLMELVNDPEKLLEFVDNYEKQKPELLAQLEREATQAERDYWKRVAENGGKPPEPEAPAVPEAEQIAQLAQTFEPGLRAALAQTAKDLGDAAQGADLDSVFDLAWSQAEQIFFEAPTDLPQFGLKAGQIGVNLDVLERLLTYDANARRAAAKGGKAAAVVETTNARTLETARRRAPGTPRPVSREAPTGEKMDRAEWARKFRAGELDD